MELVEKENPLSLADSVAVSIVIPVFNEEECLDELVARCIKASDELELSYEIILVDDGSSDTSAQKISDFSELYSGKIVGVLLNRNYGQHAAVMAGFAESRGGIVITLDADLQNPPENIPALVSKMREGFDVVGSIRMNRQDSAFRKICSAFINKVVQKTTGVMMNDYGCMLRAYRRNVIDAMLKCSERSTFIPVLANSFAKKTTEIEVTHAERAVGTSKYSLWKLINLQFDLLTSMTTFPLRLLSVIGGLISAFGIGLGVLIMALRILHGPHWAAEGVFTLFAVLFVFVGAQFLAMGLMGEYIGRIYYDVRARPRYLVQKVLRKSNRSRSGDEVSGTKSATK